MYNHKNNMKVTDFVSSLISGQKDVIIMIFHWHVIMAASGNGPQLLMEIQGRQLK